MEMILVKSRYKITQVLRAGEDYAAFLAVDIESREKTECLLNVYEGERGKKYAGYFESLQHCPEYMGMFLTDGALITVFSHWQAGTIDDKFYKGAEVDWRARLDYAQRLFHLGLSVWDYPPEISCAAFLSDNLKTVNDDRLLMVNYAIPPIDGANRRELIFMLSDQARKVLTKRLQISVMELDFIEELETGVYTSAPVLYSRWQEVRRELEEEYNKIFAMNSLQRSLHFITGHIKRWFNKRVPRKNHR